MKRIIYIILFFLLIFSVTIIFCHNKSFAFFNNITLISENNKKIGNDNSTDPSISGDGRYIVFSSWATNLTSFDTHQKGQIYLKDTSDNSITPITFSMTGGSLANGTSMSPTISSDGRYIAFASRATDLTEDKTTSDTYQIYVKDLKAEAGIPSIRLISTNTEGIPSDRSSSLPKLSSDGRFIAFESTSTDLVNPPIDNIDYKYQVYIKPLHSTSGPTKLISTDELGNPSEDGSYISFISSDGKYIGFNSKSKDLDVNNKNSNKYFQSYLAYIPSLFDKTQISLISKNSKGNIANNDTYISDISSDNKYVVIESFATNLISTKGLQRNIQQIYVKDLIQNTITLISTDKLNSVPGNMTSNNAKISENGKYIVFQSEASNLINGANGSQIYLKDLTDNSINLITQDLNGNPEYGWSNNPDISYDGSSITFSGDNTLIMVEEYGVEEIYQYYEYYAIHKNKHN